MSKIIIKTLRPVLGSDILQTMGAPIASTINRFFIYTVLHQLDQKIIYPHYDFKHLTEQYFEIGMKLNYFSIQLVKYCL